jgi:hypothetical protein
MSALHRLADVSCSMGHVRFVPKADILGRAIVKTADECRLRFLHGPKAEMTRAQIHFLWLPRGGPIAGAKIGCTQI